MTVEINYVSKITITETLTGPYIDPNNATVSVNGMDTTATLNASSTPPISKQSSGTVTLSAGAATLDLTSLPDNNGTAGAVTFLGLRVNAVKLRNKSTNANSITIVEGASNGHPLLGAAFKIILLPGEEFEFKSINTGTAVAGTDKTWDITGTGSQVLEFALGAG